MRHPGLDESGEAYEELERKRLANEASKAGLLKKKQQKERSMVLSEDEQAFENWFNKTIGYCDATIIKKVARMAWFEAIKLYKETT